MTDYSKRVKIPPYESFNKGLSPAHQQTMLDIFGRPGALSAQCSIVTNRKLLSLLQTRNVGPFRVTGLAKLLDDLEQIFSKVRSEKVDLYEQIRSDGMICCRAVRGSTNNFSNHSWGSAIDIRFGETSEEMGDGTMHLGTGELAPYFNSRGWYWGAGFGETNPSREDSMHFEASDNLIRNLYGAGDVRLPDALIKQAVIPTTPVDLLKSKLLERNQILEAVAEGHLVLRASAERVDGIGPIQDALNQLGYTINLGVNKQFRGFFGEKTEGAIKEFQRASGLDTDGRVGRETIVALDHALSGGGGAAPLAEQRTVSAETALRDRILEIAVNSQISRYEWLDRGRAPIGYTRGMALVFAIVYGKLKNRDRFAMEMGKAETGDSHRDALAWYRSEFDHAGMNNSAAGPDTLRHLFVLLTGLGMRESSGKHCEGRDMSAHNVSADTAEAGLFQVSHNASFASPLLKQLFDQYRAKPTGGFLEVFQEGAHCKASDAENFGEGPGMEFQRLSKACPAFAVEFAAIGLRHIRTHWGPIISRKAEIRRECDQMYQQIQVAVDASNASGLLV
jgi:hypothetical protein